jgi:hypothetical protein
MDLAGADAERTRTETLQVERRNVSQGEALCLFAANCHSVYLSPAHPAGVASRCARKFCILLGTRIELTL